MLFPPRARTQTMTSLEDFGYTDGQALTVIQIVVLAIVALHVVGVCVFLSLHLRQKENAPAGRLRPRTRRPRAGSITAAEAAGEVTRASTRAERLARRRARASRGGVEADTVEPVEGVRRSLRGKWASGDGEKKAQ